MVIDLGPPYNWCDRRCERCPLLDDCSLANLVREKDARARRRGQDSDDLEVTTRAIARGMEKVSELLGELAAREGLDLEEGDPVVDSPAQRLLTDRGISFAVAADKLFRRAGTSERVREAQVCAFIAGAKVARVAGYVTPAWELDDGWPSLTSDAMPNIVLIERLLQAVAEGVEALGDRADPEAFGAFERAHRDLVRALVPLTAAVDDSVRDALRLLAATGGAPSPYCVQPPTGEALSPWPTG